VISFDIKNRHEGPRGDHSSHCSHCEGWFGSCRCQNDDMGKAWAEETSAEQRIVSPESVCEIPWNPRDGSPSPPELGGGGDGDRDRDRDGDGDHGRETMGGRYPVPELRSSVEMNEIIHGIQSAFPCPS
jgi:hypothetical protein